MHLICVLLCEDGHKHAVVKMSSVAEGVLFQVDAYDLPRGAHGFHVHERGNLTDGCASLGPHYNPDGNAHGALNEPTSHRGDLGNLIIKNETHTRDVFISRRLTLPELLGRSLVIHAQHDDLGRGFTPESKTTGNSGARLCCGVIGRA